MELAFRPHYGWMVRRGCLGVVITGLAIYVFVFSDANKVKLSYWKPAVRQPGLSIDEISIPQKYRDDWLANTAVQSNLSAVNGNTSLIGQARVMLTRRQRVMDTCARLNIQASQSDTRSRFIINRPLKLAMCYVPKVGCTYWKRVFIALQRRDQTHSMDIDVFSLNKQQAHTMPSQTLNKLEKFDEAYDFLTKSTKTMFTRDPYSRLYSGYIDKFFLGDFWGLGRLIIKNSRENASQISLRCGHDVKFEEFLRYAVKIAERPGVGGADEHWFPVSKLCKPCSFKFDIIGTQETFSADRDFILSELGITAVLNQTVTEIDVVRDGIKQNIVSYWGKASDVPNPSSCISRLDMVRRMWKSFQIQGYIDETMPLPEKQISDVTTDSLLSLAMKAHSSNVLSSTEKKRQRRNVMVQAYKSIPADLMKEIQKGYSLDFELFGYPVYPKDLYPS